MATFVASDRETEAGPLQGFPYGTYLQGCEDVEFVNRLLAEGERLRYEPGAVVRHLLPECRMEKSYVLRWWY